MISDVRARRFLAASGGTLRSYDRRWWRTATVDLGAIAQASRVEIFEGVGHVMVVAHGANGEGPQVRASVRAVEAASIEVASAGFDGATWSFEGDHQVWAHVPEQLLVDAGDDEIERAGPVPPAAAGDAQGATVARARRALLRIADGATPIALEGLGDVRSALQVPGSRLVVLGAEQTVSVYDPVARRELRHLQVTSGGGVPSMRFRTPEELWVADGDTMLKLETARWEVIDAAGSQLQGNVPASSPVVGSSSASFEPLVHGRAAPGPGGEGQPGEGQGLAADEAVDRDREDDGERGAAPNSGGRLGTTTGATGSLVDDGPGGTGAGGGAAARGAFGGWTFAADHELCVVARPGLGDVLVLDALTMLPVAQAVVGGQPVDATMVGRNTIVSLDASGSISHRRARRPRLRGRTT